MESMLDAMLSSAPPTALLVSRCASLRAQAARLAMSSSDTGRAQRLRSHASLGRRQQQQRQREGCHKGEGSMRGATQG